MIKFQKGYLYKGDIVVLNKRDVGFKDAKEEDFMEVKILLTEDFIREAAEELEMLSDDDDLEDDIF